MKKNYWETVSSFCCPECGHLFLDGADMCRFCDGPQARLCGDIKSLDRIEGHMLFDDEKCFFEINFDDGF